MIMNRIKLLTILCTTVQVMSSYSIASNYYYNNHNVTQANLNNAIDNLLNSNNENNQSQNNNYNISDGNNGNEISTFVKNHFSEELLNNINKSNSIKEAINNTFLRMNE